MVAHWKYAKECADIGGGIFPGTRMRVAEVPKKPGAMRVRAELPGRTPPQCLKIAGAEIAHNFRPIR
jgi:hypothetical protein